MRSFILVIPRDSTSNPNKHYELLYRVLKKHGYEIRPFTFRNVFQYNRRAICHIHWIEIFYQGVRRRTGTDSHQVFYSWLRFMYFLLLMAVCKVCGVKIIWTIHNVASHERPGSFLERLVTKMLLIFADKVTALNKYNKKMISELYGFDNVDLMRQGLYEDCYENTITCEQARRQLNLERKDFVLLFFGGVAEYKGVDLAIEALDLIADESVKLLIVGRLKRESSYGAYIMKLAAKNKNVIIFDEYVPDDEVQIYFKAADYTIYPYRSIDNSGTLFLTLTFCVPTIIRGAGGVPEIVEINPHVAIVLDQPDKNEISQAIKRARTKKVENVEFDVFSELLSWKNLEREIVHCFDLLQ